MTTKLLFLQTFSGPLPAQGRRGERRERREKCPLFKKPHTPQNTEHKRLQHGVAAFGFKLIVFAEGFFDDVSDASFHGLRVFSHVL